MKTLFDDTARALLAERVRRLTPQTERRWGSMTAGRMICHAADQLRMAIGELPAGRPASGLLRLPGFKHFVIHVMPWPKGARTAPELLTTTPAEFEADRERLLDLMEAFAARDPGAPWSEHPLFGVLSGKTWGALAARHLDHHLQQFGV